MNKRLVEIIEKSLMEYIVERVIEKILEKEKTALVLFTGATIGFKQSIESLNKLQEKGWKFNVVLSNAAREVLTEDLIKSSLNIEKVITEDDKPNLSSLLSENNIVIIPSLTVNSASKIANCISDTLITNIVSKALMSGKKIVASINACCIDNKERIAIYGNNTNEFYKKTLRSHLEAIQNYGVILTSSENLANKIEKNIIVNKNTNNNEKINVSLNQQKQNVTMKKSSLASNKSVKINKKLISRTDIYENRNYDTLIFNENAIITDLAKDEARKLKIKLLKR